MICTTLLFTERRISGSNVRGVGLPALHIPLNFRIASCQIWNLIVCARNSAMLGAVHE